MSADARLDELYRKFNSSLNLVTNVMTPEGRKVACTWVHIKKFRDMFESGVSNGHEDVTCMVTGDSLEEVIRKVAEMEDAFSQNGG